MEDEKFPYNLALSSVSNSALNTDVFKKRTRINPHLDSFSVTYKNKILISDSLITHNKPRYLKKH